jgi:gamma-glutamylcyclotransferase (GGCT)/AIG2-like uncharacterized protein YtfP
MRNVRPLCAGPLHIPRQNRKPAGRMSHQPTSIFVYGTLQRGQCRERCWPLPPLRIEPATVRGELYDLGPYPALIEGDYCVAGELCHLAADDLTPTLEELDRVEGYLGRANDLYQRVTITCQTAEGPVEAWTYRYAQTSQLKPIQRIKPDPVTGQCRWPART